MVPGNISVVEVGNSEVEKNIEKQRKIKKSKIKTVICRTHRILHRHIDTENPKRLNKQVQRNQKKQVYDKLFSQNGFYFKFIAKSSNYLSVVFNFTGYFVFL